jgi:hypothetical protein
VLTVNEFVAELETSISKHFSSFRFIVLLQTFNSYKAHIVLNEGCLISARYNTRNERTDFALILNQQRIFGYDNLKSWHYHPYSDPSQHIPCSKPTIDQVISEMKAVFDEAK